VTAFLKALRDDVTGSAMVEFAIVGPALIMMLLGVLQIGVGLQNYNALRNASSEVARSAMIQYSSGNILPNDQLSALAYNAAEASPYLLKSSRLTAKVTDAATQRVTGATEKTLVMTYKIPSMLESLGLSGPEITYSRPLFLTTPT